MKITLNLSDEQVKKMKKYLDDVGEELPIKKESIRFELQAWFDDNHPSHTLGY